METIKDTVAAEDSEEVTLCCGIGGYNIPIQSAAMEIWTCSNVWESRAMLVDDYYAVAVKKHLDIFHDKFHVLILCFS